MRSRNGDTSLKKYAYAWRPGAGDKIAVHSESRAAVLRLTAIIRKLVARAEPRICRVEWSRLLVNNGRAFEWTCYFNVDIRCFLRKKSR